MVPENTSEKSVTINRQGVYVPKDSSSWKMTWKPYTVLGQVFSAVVLVWSNCSILPVNRMVIHIVWICQLLVCKDGRKLRIS